MTIKKFDLRGLDQTANVRVVTTDNLTANLVQESFYTAFPNLLLGGQGATGATGPPGATGGLGGLGGGGNGESNTVASTAGSANTGGGGGAGHNTGVSTGGKAGGSGIVILRIPVQYSATFSAGITANVAASTSQVGYRTYTVTAGTGTVTFS